jgi:hypothetical protein
MVLWWSSIPAVVEIEDKLLVPARVEIFLLGLRALFLLFQIYFHKRAGNGKYKYIFPTQTQTFLHKTKQKIHSYMTLKFFIPISHSIF